MAHTLRAASNLKAATALLGSIIAGGVIIVGAGAATPVVLGMSKEGVTSVVNLEDSYTLTYGQDITPIMEKVKVTVGNGFNKEGKTLDGTVLKLEGYDSEYIGTKEVIASYMDYSKRINVTINADKLKTPSPQFNNATGILSWEPVNNGETYTVVLTDNGTGTEISRSTNSAANYDLNNIGFYTKYDVAVFASNSKKGSNGVSTFIDSESSQKITLQKLNQVQNLTYDQEAGAIKWDAIDASSYEVVVNGSTFNPTTPSQVFNMANPGTYNVSVRGVAGAGAYATPTTATYRRLPSPVLSYTNNEISVKDGETLSFLRNGEAFNGDVTSITEAGEHKIKAKNTSTNNYELESAWSDEITLTKLTPLVISLSDGVLQATGVSPNNSARWFVDGEEFDGQLSTITGAGTHRITAKHFGSGNTIPSEASNEIVITKLQPPVATFDGYAVTFSNTGDNFHISVDGERREETEVTEDIITALSDNKVHTISGVNYGDGETVFDSDPSNEVTIVVPTITSNSYYEKNQAGTTNYVAYVKVTHDIEGRSEPIKAKLTVRYFKDGVEDTNRQTSEIVDISKDGPKVGPLRRSMGDGTIVDEVRFVFELMDVEGLQIFKRTIVETVKLP